jgi:hypothetical protein
MNGLEDFRNTKVGEGAREAGALQFGGREVVGGAAGIARVLGEVPITSNDVGGAAGIARVLDEVPITSNDELGWRGMTP